MFVRGSLIVVRCRNPASDCHEQRTTNNQLFYDPQKVRYLRNDPTSRGSVRPGHRLIELRDPEASDDLLLLLRVADRAAIILDGDVATLVFSFLCHTFRVRDSSRTFLGEHAINRAL